VSAVKAEEKNWVQEGGGGGKVLSELMMEKKTITIN